MQTEKLIKFDVKKLPPQTVIIELLDENKTHLAFIACRHERGFFYSSYGNDYELSQFLEESADFESQILRDFIEIDCDMEKRFGGWTGKVIVTDKDSRIIYYDKPAS